MGCLQKVTWIVTCGLDPLIWGWVKEKINFHDWKLRWQIMFGVFLAVILTEITVFCCAVFSVKVLLLKTEVLIPRYLEANYLNFIT